MFEYLIWLSIFVWLPTVLLWMKFYKILIPFKRVFLYTILGSVMIGGIWDNIAIKENVWYFPKEKMLNLWILGLPIEEWFFIIFVTLLASTITIIIKTKSS
jgi:lycopene cyclase domain-containing protein